MSPLQLIQLVMGLLRLANWITRKIDQTTWETSGYQKAVLEQTAAIAKSVKAAEKAVAEAGKLSPEELKKRLQDET